MEIPYIWWKCTDVLFVDSVSTVWWIQDTGLWRLPFECVVQITQSLGLLRRTKPCGSQSHSSGKGLPRPVCVPPMPCQPFSQVTYDFVLARRPGPNWINKKEGIAQVTEKSGNPPFSLSTLSGPEDVTRTLSVSQLCGSSSATLSLTLKERAAAPGLKSAQFRSSGNTLLISAIPDGSPAHCWYITMAGKRTLRTSWDEDEEDLVLHREMEVQQSEKT